jgi:hypothetical protein
VYQERKINNDEEKKREDRRRRVKVDGIRGENEKLYIYFYLFVMVCSGFDVSNGKR